MGTMFKPPLYIATADGETISIQCGNSKELTIGAVRGAIAKMRDKLGVDATKVLKQLDELDQRAQDFQRGGAPARIIEVSEAVTVEIREDSSGAEPYESIAIGELAEDQQLADRAIWIDLKVAPAAQCAVNCNRCAQIDIDRQARVIATMERATVK